MEVEVAMQKLKDHGFKYTQKREKMLEIFSNINGYLSVKEVYQKIKQEYPTISLNTVYLNISFFEEAEVLETTDLNGEKVYRFSCADHHHHHIICTECGKVQVINICPMDSIFGNPPGFTITGHKFEIYGYCDDCKK
ncbi:Fur family transcriptional regulator [Evansella sp. AB-rgal1]|uniref:Fur family transcriptional regulator n=1 Tax=Evansella sp. AB-rgal1 TaxID=3242696 RepID=UPI00359CDA86